MSTDTQEVLEESGLRYSTDSKPGYTRKKVGDSFEYFDTNSNKITDEKVLERIKSLVIPPAWEKVWICPNANGYLQATGIDARKRKQYRYHPKWNKATQQQKFEHMIDFAKVLPRIRRKVREHMAQSGMPYEKIVATIVYLLEKTLIRVGNEEYEKENKSFGLTTLKNRHVDVSKDGEVTFQFKGKSGVYHDVHLQNKRIAKIINKCQDLPGQDLFEYKDENKEIRSISSDDVNNYLKNITGIDITAKDFRTWGGTIIAASKFDKLGISESATDAKKYISETVKFVASKLRNRPATCRKYYIHPLIIELYGKGRVLSTLRNEDTFKKFQPINDLDECENTVLCLLISLTSGIKTPSRKLSV